MMKLEMLKSVAGRQVPFTPKQFPIRLSRRIGLRTIGSLGAKKVVACPSGEQIVNGGFELGDFGENPPTTIIGWEYQPDIYIVNYHPHSGNYHAILQITPSRGWLKQTFGPVILVECVESFSLWAFNPLGEGYVCFVVVTLEYDDDTTDAIEFNVTTEDYVELDVKPFLQSGKKIKSVKLESREDNEAAVYVDDVSLIGSG
jgi:hypothetical protein